MHRPSRRFYYTEKEIEKLRVFIEKEEVIAKTNSSLLDVFRNIVERGYTDSVKLNINEEIHSLKRGIKWKEEDEKIKLNQPSKQEYTEIVKKQLYTLDYEHINNYEPEEWKNHVSESVREELRKGRIYILSHFDSWHLDYVCVVLVGQIDDLKSKFKSIHLPWIVEINEIPFLIRSYILVKRDDISNWQKDTYLPDQFRFRIVYKTEKDTEYDQFLFSKTGIPMFNLDDKPLYCIAQLVTKEEFENTGGHNIQVAIWH